MVDRRKSIWQRLTTCGGLAVLLVVMGATAATNPFAPASPASVASAQEPAPGPQPQPTPAPTPDPLPAFTVKLEGPTKATGGFAVTVTKPAAAVCRWRNELPAGSFPLELTDNAGRTVLCFFSPAPGVHRFNLAAQLPVDGLDPFAEAVLVVEVGGVQPAPPGPAPVDPSEPGTPTPTTDPTTKATAAVYVYEKDQTAIPSAVLSGLNRLNREKKIIATLLERDVTNDKITTPAQYVAPLAAAKEAGLPCLVVMANSTVLKVVKNPTTEAQVLEVAP